MEIGTKKYHYDILHTQERTKQKSFFIAGSFGESRPPFVYFFFVYARFFWCGGLGAGATSS